MSGHRLIVKGQSLWAQMLENSPPMLSKDLFVSNRCAKQVSGNSVFLAAVVDERRPRHESELIVLGKSDRRVPFLIGGDALIQATDPS